MSSSLSKILETGINTEYLTRLRAISWFFWVPRYKFEANRSKGFWVMIGHKLKQKNRHYYFLNMYRSVYLARNVVMRQMTPSWEISNLFLSLRRISTLHQKFATWYTEVHLNISLDRLSCINTKVNLNFLLFCRASKPKHHARLKNDFQLYSNPIL